VISLIDTHCHIDLPAFDEDREAVLSRALAKGVHAMVVVGHNPERWRTTARLQGQCPFLVRTVGLHPNDASQWTVDVEKALEAELQRGDAVAVGETGLDFFRDSAPPDLQRAAFEAQIGLAKQLDLPIVIHQRAAETEVLEMVRSLGPVRGVLHCFSGDEAFANACLEAGLMLGVGGVATYPKSDAIRAALAVAPLDNIVVETDAPYLAPQSWRGKRNEPAYVVAAAEILATIHDLPVDVVAERTSANAIRLFGDQLVTAQQSGRTRAE